MINKLRKSYIELKQILDIPKQISNIPEIVSENTFYPDKKRKSKYRMSIDNLLWIIKNREINQFYNSYGLDIKNWRNPDDFLPNNGIINDRNNGNIYLTKERFSYNYLAVLRDKYLFASYLAQVIGEDKVVPTLALYSNNEIYLPIDKTYISLEDFFKEDKKVFCKVNNGECAKGIFIIESNNHNYYLNDEKTSLSEIKLQLNDSRFIFQDLIQQHEALSLINSSSVNTIRIITVKGISGDVNIFFAYLRLGANEKSFVDNIAVGGIAVGIDNNGVLGEYGFLKSSFGTKVDRHPISDVEFEGYQLPYWNEVKDLVKNAHKQLYYFQSIGWDVAITPNGPILIEGNDNWEIRDPQNIDGGLKEKWHRLKMS